MCVNCGNTQNPYAVYNVQYVYKDACTDCGNAGCESTLKAGCVFYTSANLANAGVLTNDSLEVVLQKIDTRLAAVAANYAGYTTGCIGPVATEAEFVQKMTAYACTLRTDHDTFVGTTFPAYQTVVDNRFKALETPGQALAHLEVLATDSLNTVLSKINVEVGNLYALTDLSAVVWDNCFAVVPPTTLAQGFQTVLDQLCLLKTGAGGAVLPTFNNVGSVLANPGAADTLEATVIKLRDRVNLLPTFDVNALAWQSIAKPSAVQTDLQAAFAAVLAKLDALATALPSFDAADFTVTAVDGSNPYLGRSVALAASLNVDRFVALDAGDNAPGTLLGKLQAGAGMEFDTASVPGKLVLKATALGGNYQVKASSTDAAPGFLDAKLKGNTDTDYVTTSVSYDAGDQKAQVTAALDLPGLTDAILSLAETDATIKARLCAILSTCPSPCAAPQNVQVIAVP